MDVNNLIDTSNGYFLDITNDHVYIYDSDTDFLSDLTSGEIYHILREAGLIMNLKYGKIELFNDNNNLLSSAWIPQTLVVEDAQPTHVVITFPSAKTISAGDFTIAGFTVSSGSWAGSVYTLVLSTAVVYGDVLNVVYKTKSYPVTNNVTDKSNIWYGYQLDESNSSPDVTRIAGSGNMALHASLPVQSLIKGCVINDSGVLQYYLKTDDWTKKADGSASNLDGTDGQLMVEIPRFYHLIENPSAGIYQHKISLYPVTGFVPIPKMYIAPSQAQMHRPSSKLSSVRSLSTDYRGGGNNAAWDALDKTLLGKPATDISLTSFRTYARNRGSKWNVLPYRQVMLLYDLYIIEYATRNSQKAVNTTLTAEGYKQGGMGAGVTEFWDWANYNGYYPIVPCGGSDSLGNGSGEVNHLVPGSGVSVKIPRYRGIENIFGHIWEWTDGASIYHQTAGEGNLHKFYTCDAPANFADNTVVNYDYRCDLPVEGWVKNVTHDVKGIMVPKTVLADSVTNYCDYYYTPAAGGGYWVAVLRGGSAYDGGGAGFVLLFTDNAASNAGALLGARLCYIP